MARSRAVKQKGKKRGPVEAGPEFREVIAYLNGVADAVTSQRAPAVEGEASPQRGRTPSHRPTLRYGQDAEEPFEAPAARRRTIPYGESGAPDPAVAEGERAELPLPPELPWAEDVLERPSGIRLRCAPLRQEWYDLAGAGRRK